MHLLIVIGAGASHDCWLEHIPKPIDHEDLRLPLANLLFSHIPYQNTYLQKYNLMGLAGTLRNKARMQGQTYDVEVELATIYNEANTRKDYNGLQNLFKARFYLHSLITNLTQLTLEHTYSHTVYVDLLNKLKDWIDQSPSTRFVDIVVFNYDNLLEKAMENVYNYDWQSKKTSRH